jgi:ABC-type transport system involved in multi-copper enzyme maturation permease subunit
MKTIQTLIYKDLRRFWPHALTLLALLLIYLVYLPRIEHIQPKQLNILFFLLPMAVFAIWIFSISTIVHESPPTGTTEFWMTRPISGARLFVSKYITLALFFALMPALVLVASRMLGLLEPRAVSLETFAGTLSGFLVFTLCIMLLATLTRNATQLFFCIAIIAVGFFTAIILIIGFSHSPQPPHPPKPILQNIELFGWLMSSLTIAGLTAIIHTQYTRRSKPLTISATALLALLLFAIYHLWPTTPKP